MKHRNQLTILMALTTIAIIGLSMVLINPAHAVNIPIGDPSFLQSNGYDSNPTAGVTLVQSGTYTFSGTPANARDGDPTGTNINWIMGGGTTTTTPYKLSVTMNTFENTPPGEAFTIGWVDMKVSYKASATTDDRYRIICTLGAFTVAKANVTLQDWISGASAKFDYNGVQDERAWSNIARPGGGAWTWADIANLYFRVETQRVGTLDATARFTLYEVWLTIYSGTYPGGGGGGATVSIQPPELSGLGVGSPFYIDVFVTGVTNMHGFQFKIDYNPQVLQSDEYFAYNPFITAAPSELNNSLNGGYAAVAFSSFMSDAVGFTGSGPVVRIYFHVVAEARSPLHFSKSILSTTTGLRIEHTLTDGVYAGPEWLSATANPIPPFNYVQIDLMHPIGTMWHEIFPEYSRMRTLTSWTDNGDNYLSASDQIDMTNETGWTYWYHVDAVTVTIHFTYKDTYPDAKAVAEASPPIEVLPTNPIGSTWHQIYPPGNFSRTFTITSWTDNGNGKFDPSDQFDWEYDDAPGMPVNAHLDAVSTDMIVSQKPIPPEPPIAEFPLGLGIVMALAPMVSIVYIWRLRKNKGLKQ